MLIKSFLAVLALGVLAGCATTTTTDAPYYHYRGHVGPDGIDSNFSNRY
jgi:carbonic anhydrase